MRKRTCMNSMSSIREVARRAGVSLGTVSNVLNRPEIVAEETRRRVQLAIEEIAFVLLDRPSRIKDLCSVAVDDVRGGEIATTHLLEQGHERIAFVHGPLSIRQCADRKRGVLRAMKSADLDPDRAIVDITTPAQSAKEGEEVVEQLLIARIKPTAVFCANDLLALGLMRGLIKRGIAIPRDIAM